MDIRILNNTKCTDLTWNEFHEGVLMKLKTRMFMYFIFDNTLKLYVKIEKNNDWMKCVFELNGFRDKTRTILKKIQINKILNKK